MQFFLSLLISGLVFGSIYALVALGFVLIYKATGIINFAQGEMVMFGAYICIGLATNMGLPLLVAIPLAMVGSALLGRHQTVFAQIDQGIGLQMLIAQLHEGGQSDLQEFFIGSRIIGNPIG